MNAHVGSVILTDASDAPDAPDAPPRFLLGVDNCLGAVPSKYASIAASSSSALKSKYFGAVNSHLRRRRRRHKVTKLVCLSLSRLNESFNFNSVHARHVRFTYLFDVVGVAVSVGMVIFRARRSWYRPRVVRRTRASMSVDEECTKRKRLFI